MTPIIEFMHFGFHLIDEVPMALQNITVRNIGKRLQLSIRGQLVGIHPH